MHLNLNKDNPLEFAWNFTILCTLNNFEGCTELYDDKDRECPREFKLACCWWIYIPGFFFWIFCWPFVLVAPFFVYTFWLAATIIGPPSVYVAAWVSV